MPAQCRAPAGSPAHSSRSVSCSVRSPRARHRCSADDGSNALQPSRWPSGPGASPRIEAVAHALRFLGADRFETNLAVTLALRGGGAFPYSTSDRTSGGASSLASVERLVGRAVVPEVGDRRRGRQLRRRARGDVAVRSDRQGHRSAARARRRGRSRSSIPIGGFARPDMALAPIIVTASGRQGATTLVDQLADRRAGHGRKADARPREARSSSAAREQSPVRSRPTC